MGVAADRLCTETAGPGQLGRRFWKDPSISLSIAQSPSLLLLCIACYWYMLARAYTVRFGCGWERMLFLFPCQILNTVMCCAPVYIYIYSRQFGLRADLFQHFPGNLKDWRTIWAAAAAPVESFLNGLPAPRDELTRQLTSSSSFCCPFDATTTAAAMQAPLCLNYFQERESFQLV